MFSSDCLIKRHTEQGFSQPKKRAEGGGQRTEGEWVYLYGIDVLLITFIKLSTPPSQKDTQEEVFTMESSTLLSPQTLTAVEILESIDASHRNQALEMLRNFVYELRNEREWEELYSKHPGPMIALARQALKDHKEGKSRKL